MPSHHRLGASSKALSLKALTFQLKPSLKREEAIVCTVARTQSELTGAFAHDAVKGAA